MDAAVLVLAPALVDAVDDPGDGLARQAVQAGRFVSRVVPLDRVGLREVDRPAVGVGEGLQVLHVADHGEELICGADVGDVLRAEVVCADPCERVEEGRRDSVRRVDLSKEVGEGDLSGVRFRASDAGGGVESVDLVAPEVDGRWGVLDRLDHGDELRHEVDAAVVVVADRHDASIGDLDLELRGFADLQVGLSIARSARSFAPSPRAP